MFLGDSPIFRPPQQQNQGGLQPNYFYSDSVHPIVPICPDSVSRYLSNESKNECLFQSYLMTHFAHNPPGGHFGFRAPENSAGIFRRYRGPKFLLKCPKNPKQVIKILDRGWSHIQGIRLNYHEKLFLFKFKIIKVQNL